MRGVFGVCLLLATVCVQASELRDLRLLDGPDSTRVVFDLDTETAPKVFTLANPDRVVIDFADAKRAAGLRLASEGKGLIKTVRTGPHENGLRVVLDLGSPAAPKSFGLEASGSYGYRVIVDLYPQGAKGSSRVETAPLVSSAPETPGQITAAVEPTPAPPAPTVIAPPPAPVLAPASAPIIAATSAPQFNERIQIGEKPIVIAVDAGHGGQDPGAHGRGGLLEKDVTLSIAQKLVKKINAQPGMRAVLTRDGDYFIDLRERTVKAREAQADLFVSIHANAYKDRDMRGTAVYVLSNRGATSEQALWIANRENAADLVGGVKLQNKDDDLAAVLIDISQSATMEASFDLGNRLLESMGKVNALQKPQVQQAGFLVLKSPDIPSVLVETAFISNPREEKLLRDPNYQDKLASSIFEGVHGYFARYRPLQQIAVSANKNEVARRAKAMPVNLNRPGTE